MTLCAGHDSIRWMLAMITRDEPISAPQIILEAYQRAFRQVNGYEPHIRHLGGHWYQVNGETVHRTFLMVEISRLRDLAQRQRPTPDKSIIQRLIGKLRGI